MTYQNVVPAVFLSRPNRFVANVVYNGEEIAVHVKNTGRCRELLVPGARVYLTMSDNKNRKYKFDLIAVEKKTDRGVLLINMDSFAPNIAAEEWVGSCGLFSKNAVVRHEVSFGSSRFDLYVSDGERKAFIEVKGVTLEHDGVASFPDAPTERGIKHVEELISCRKAGYEAYILFVVQMKGIRIFKPNDETHAAFGDALRKAYNSGVNILVRDCLVTPDSMEIDEALLFDL